MKRKLLTAAILCAALCLCACFALADGFMMTEGNGNVLNDGDSLSGRYYYKLYFSGLPVSCSSIRVGRSDNLSAAAPDSWESEPQKLKKDKRGEYLLVMPAPETGGDRQALFFRADGDNAVRKILLQYDRTAMLPAGQAPVVERMEALKVGMTYYRVKWSAVSRAEFYRIRWELPGGRTEVYQSSDNYLDLALLGGQPTAECGDYTVQVYAYGNGRFLQSSDPAVLTFDPLIDFEVDWEASETAVQNEDGSVTVDLHGDLGLQLYAPGNAVSLLLADSIPEDLTDSDCLADRLPAEQHLLDRDRIAEKTCFVRTWGELPDHWSGSGEFIRYLVLESHLNGGTLHRREILPVHVRVLYGSMDAIRYELPDDVNNVVNGIPQVPLDGLLYVDVVSHSDANAYRLYIAREGVGQTDHPSDWIADSGRVVRSDEYTTRLALAVPRCEAGKDYEVHIAAIAYGSPVWETAETLTVHVTAAENGNVPAGDPMIVSMGGDHYTTGDVLWINACYTDPEPADGWLNIQIVNRDDPGEVLLNARGDLDGFRNSGLTCWQSGNYAVNAYVLTAEGVYASYPGIRTFTVEGEGNIAELQILEDVTELEIGDDLEIVVNAKPKTENDGTFAPMWFIAKVIRTDRKGETVAEKTVMAEDGQASITIEKDLFQANGCYQVQLLAVKEGCISASNEFRFITRRKDLRQDLTLTLDGKTTSIYSWPSGAHGVVHVDYHGDRPTVVRILNGDHWEYIWRPEESFNADWAFSGSGDYLLYAEASWDCDYDLTEMEQNGWEIMDDGWIISLDWERDVNWTARSNVIHVYLDESNGGIAAPVFTIDNPELGEGGSGVIPWGDDLVIRIPDSAPSFYVEETGETADAWYYCTVETEKIDPETGLIGWQGVGENGYYLLQKGVNHIPTYHLQDGSRCRLSVGLDAEGFRRNPQVLGFRIGKRPSEQEPIRSFRVNGTTGNLSVEVGSEVELAVYRTGAVWYKVMVLSTESEGFEEKNACEDGMLIDSWRPDKAGTYLLKATAYGQRMYGSGTAISTENYWQDDSFDIITVTVTSRGTLGPIDLSLRDDVAWHSDPLWVTYNGPEETESYSYRIHSYKDSETLVSGSWRTTGEETYLKTTVLDPGVYIIEFDAEAVGYLPSHTRRYCAMIGKSGWIRDGDHRYCYDISDREISDGETVNIIAYMADAEAVRLDWSAGEGYALKRIEYSNHPGAAAVFEPAGPGEYTIWFRGKIDGTWTEPIELDTVTVIEGEDPLPVPAVTINDTEEGLKVPPKENEPNRIDLTIDGTFEAERYRVVLRDPDEDEPFYTGVYRPEDDSEVGVSLRLEKIRPGGIYELTCTSMADGRKSSAVTRTFILQTEDVEPTVSLQVVPPGDDGYWTMESAYVRAGATDATAIKLCINNKAQYFRGSEFDTYVTIRNPMTVFCAFATTDPIPEGEETDWDDLRLDWSMQSEMYCIEAHTNGKTEVPTLTFNDHVVKGDWFEFVIEDDGDAWETELRIRTDDGEEKELRRFYAPGTYRIPTVNLASGRRYLVSLRASQDRHMWTKGPVQELYVDPAAQPSAFFRVSKTRLYQNEPFIATVSAPGASDIWITDSSWDRETDLGKAARSHWSGELAANSTEEEWSFALPGEYGLTAWALYPDSGTSEEIGSVTVTVLEKTPLDAPQILVPDELDVLQENEIRIVPVENGYYYTVQFYYPGEDPLDWGYAERTAQSIDEESGRIIIPVPRGRLGPDRSYRIVCHADPLPHDYAHTGSDGGRGFMTTEGETRDDSITVSVDPGENVTVLEDEVRIPVNTGFDITVTAAGSTAPGAVAVSMGDQIEYRRFEGSSVTIHMSEERTGPQMLFARAYDESPEEDTEGNVNWEGLDWNPAANAIRIVFTSIEKAGTAQIRSFDDVVIAGDPFIVPVTPGSHANEVRANLNVSQAYWQEEWALDAWVSPDPETGTICLPTAGIEPGTYRVTVDNNGPGYGTSRTWVFVHIAEDPYQTEMKLALPGSLKEIEAEAFAGIAAETVIIPNGVTKIGSRAFAGSRAVRVVIPDSVTRIEADAFAGSSLRIIYGRTQLAADFAGDHQILFCRIK